jgi:4-hydroxybenzoate polyprenyltransferase
MKQLAAGLLRIFVFSNLFIAVCAVLMANQTFYLLLKESPLISLKGFIFFSTVCSYSFHWYLASVSSADQARFTWVNEYRKVYILLFFVGLTGAALFLYDMVYWWPWLLVPVIMTFLYSAPKIPLPLFRALRKVALGKTIFLAFVWMYVTTVLPVVVSDRPWSNDFFLFVIYRFFYIYAICIIFDYRDREDDKRSGVKSLITYLPDKAITAIFYLSLVIGSVCAILLAGYGISIINVVLLIIPGIITLLIYERAKKNFSELLYYFVLDGLMALSAVLMLIARI